MSIDMSTPFDFLKTMRLSDYEHTNDFFADFHEQPDLYAIDKNARIKDLEKKLAECEVEANNEMVSYRDSLANTYTKTITDLEKKLALAVEELEITAIGLLQYSHIGAVEGMRTGIRNTLKRLSEQ